MNIQDNAGSTPIEVRLMNTERLLLQANCKIANLTTENESTCKQMRDLNAQLLVKDKRIEALTLEV